MGVNKFELFKENANVSSLASLGCGLEIIVRPRIQKETRIYKFEDCVPQLGNTRVESRQPNKLTTTINSYLNLRINKT